MNRYPLWLNILIAVIVLGGLLYALPNFFGESPAVQVSAATPRGQGRRRAAQARRGRAQAGRNLPCEASFLDETERQGALQRHRHAAQGQGCASSEALGDDYVVALNLLSNSPRWLAAIGAKPMYLGLDLRGGVHFLLQVDMKGAITKSLDSPAAGIRTTLRGEEDARCSGISREGQQLVVRFKRSSNRDKAQPHHRTQLSRTCSCAARNTMASIVLVGTLKPDAQKRIQEFAIQQNLTTLRNRVNELGVAEPIVQQAGRRSHRGAAARRAGHGEGQGHSRAHRHAGSAHGGRGAQRSCRRCRRPSQGQVPFGSELLLRPRGPVPSCSRSRWC